MTVALNDSGCRGSTAITRLLDGSGPKLASERESSGDLGRYPDLCELLALRNGFLALDGTIEVFPLAAASAGPNQLCWNHPEFWRRDYPTLDHARAHVYAHDAFTRQFAIDEVGRILRLDLETAELSLYSATLEEWAWRVERDRAESAFGRLAREWVRINGPLDAGDRLAPRIPFSLGGDRTIENVERLDVLEVLTRARETRQRMKPSVSGTEAG